MINASQIKKLRQFVQQQLEQICYFKPSNRLLINQIIRIITTSDFVGVVGEYGTGKRQIVDEIIGPVLNEFFGLSSKTKYDLNINNPRIDEILSGNSDKALIISECDPSSLFDSDLTPTLRLVQESLTDNNILRIPSLQQQYLTYPEIIAKIIKQEYGIPISRISIDFCGYTESIISGLPGNYLELEKIIQTEIFNFEELYKVEKPPGMRFGFYLRFNTYFDKLPNRKELWRSFWCSKNTFLLTKIKKFNREYLKNVPGPVQTTSSGPFRRIPY